MATTEPLTGLSASDNSDAPYTGGQQIGIAVKGLAPLVVPRYASATARDTAWANWIAGQAAGTKIPDGATCRLTSDDRLWRYDQTNSLWTWDMSAQGQLGRSDWVPTSSGFVLNNVPTDLPALAFTIPSIAPRRRLQVIFSGSLHSDAAPGCYGFLHYIGGNSYRGQVQTNIVGASAAFTILHQFDSGNSALTNVACSISGGRFGGSGTFWLDPAPDSPTSFIVNDLGGY